MEYNKKVLKIAAKITAASLSESGKLDSESAEKTVVFLKELYSGIAPLRENEDCAKDAFKAAGKITAAACEEMEEGDGKTAADFFKTVYEGIAPMAESKDFDEDVFKYTAKITAAACEEMEEPDEEKAKEAAEFFKAVYFGLTAEEKPEEPAEEEASSAEPAEEEPACGGKYSVKETESGFSFRLLAGNSQVIGVSEVYSSRGAMEKGIKAVRKAAPEAKIEDQTVENPETVKNPKFEIYNDKAGEFRFRLKARNGEIILASEGYKTKASCENGIESVRKNSAAKICE